MNHFVYKHIPAQGLGIRSPRRPYITGGLGGPTFLFPLTRKLNSPVRYKYVTSVVEGVRE